jgi:hypothetical protein
MSTAMNSGPLVFADFVKADEYSMVYDPPAACAGWQPRHLPVFVIYCLQLPLFVIIPYVAHVVGFATE